MKNRGVTLVEVLVAIFISMVIFSALFMVLNMGELQNRMGSTRIDVQQEVRRAMDWMVKDLRQTQGARISVINASGGPDTFETLGPAEVFEAPEFPVCIAFVPGTGSGTGITWSPYTITYDFDAANYTATRTDSGTGQVHSFKNIGDLVFTKIGTYTLQIDISGQKVARSGLGGEIIQYYNLSEEVRLRND